MKSIKYLFLLLFLFTIQYAFAQGDSCTTATPIVATGNFTADGPATGGGAINPNATNSDWYTFVCPANGKITVSSCNDPGGTDTRLWIYSGTCAALIPVADSDDENGCSALTNFASEVADLDVINGTTYYIEWDDRWTTNGFDWEFTFVPNPPNDVGTNTIIEPSVSGCGLSNMTPVVASIQNFGTDPVSNVSASLFVDAALVATETIAGPIASGASLNYNFTATADLSAGGVHTVQVVSTVTGDVNMVNDTATTSVENYATVNQLPVSDDFESYALGDITFAKLFNSPASNIDWEVNSGTTTSTATGPTDDASGGGQYIYMETSSPAVAGDQAILLTNCIDLTNAINPQLDFAYHMFGSSIRSLDVDVIVTGTATNVLSLTGQQQTANADPWLLSNIDLTPFVGNIVQIAFIGEIEADASGTTFNGDIALDEIEITDPLPSDIGVISIDSPLSACSLTNMETVTVTVENFGTTSESNFDVSYTVSGPGGPVNITEVFTGTLAPNTSAQFTFAATVDMSALGTYMLTATTGLASDSNTANDAFAATILSGGATLPISDNFDSYPDGTDVFPALFNDPSDQMDWEVNFGATGSLDTGPNDDVSGGGGYLYIETSGSSTGDVATICTDCINLTGANSPRLEFSYHMYGGSIDSLIVYVNNGTTTTTEFVLIGEQQTSESDPWQNASVNLGAYVGQVISICFSGNVKPGPTGNLFNGDMAIDEIAIIAPNPNDMGAVDLVSPMQRCQLSSTETITAELYNFGATPETGFDVTYEITGPSGTITQTENVGALNLAAGTGGNYTFSAPADMSTLGTYTIQIWTDLTGDSDTTNDSTSVITITTGGSPIPQAEDFNSYADGSTIFNDLTNQPGNDIDWQVNFGGTGSADTGPLDDVSVGGGYIYTEASGSADGDAASICTGCLDLTTAVNPQLEFSYHMFGSSIGDLTVTIDDGNAVTTLVTLNGPQQTASADPWVPIITDLTPYVGSVVSLCFTGSIRVDSTNITFRGDMALDNIIVREPPTCPDPFSLTAINIADVSAEASWMTGGNAVDAIVEYGPTGFTPGTGTIINPATNPQPITGLMPQTTYDIYVTENCGAMDGMSLLIGPIAFTTNCAPFPFPGNYFSNPIPVTTIPFTDNSSTSACYVSDFNFNGNTSPDVFYRIIPDPCANEVTLSLCGSSFDTRLILINEADSTVIAQNDDDCGLQSQLVVPVQGSAPLLAIVEGFGSTSTGTYVFNVTQNISTGINFTTLSGNRLTCPSANDGVIYTDVDGGVLPQNFIWSNGATSSNLTGLAPGVYDLTVTDNCSGFSTASFEVLPALVPTVDAGPTQTLCLGQFAVLGGSPTSFLDLDTVFTGFGVDAFTGNFFKSNIVDPTNLVNVTTGLPDDYFAGDFGPGGFFVMEQINDEFIKLDTVTGAATIIGTAGILTGHTWTGLAWDASTATFHALSTDGAVSQLYTINVGSGVATPTVPLNLTLPIWLAIDNFGAAYTLDMSTDTLHTVDLITGASNPLPNGIGFDANFAQDADFDPFTNQLYLAAYNNDNSSPELRLADLTTGETTFIGPITTGEVTAYGIIGPPEYTYTWSPAASLDDPTSLNPTATPTMTTTYTLVVTEVCGVVATAEVEVVVNSLPLANAGADVAQCTDDYTILTATGGNVYTWSTGETGATIVVTPVMPTTYYVTVTDAVCTAFDSVLVTPVVTAVPVMTVSGAVLTSTAAVSYQWYFDAMPIPGATMQTYTANQDGVYWVETIDTNGCMSMSNSEFLTNVPTSLDDFASINSFKAYPNPMDNQLIIELESTSIEELSLELMSVVGQVIHMENIQVNGLFTTTLDVDQLPAGMYIVKLSNEKGILQKRVVKQ